MLATELKQYNGTVDSPKSDFRLLPLETCSSMQCFRTLGSQIKITTKDMEGAYMSSISSAFKDMDAKVEMKRYGCAANCGCDLCRKY